MRCWHRLLNSLRWIHPSSSPLEAPHAPSGQRSRLAVGAPPRPQCSHSHRQPTANSLLRAREGTPASPQGAAATTGSASGARCAERDWLAGSAGPLRTSPCALSPDWVLPRGSLAVWGSAEGCCSCGAQPFDSFFAPDDLSGDAALPADAEHVLPPQRPLLPCRSERAFSTNPSACGWTHKQLRTRRVSSPWTFSPTLGWTIATSNMPDFSSFGVSPSRATLRRRTFGSATDWPLGWSTLTSTATSPRILLALGLLHLGALDAGGLQAR